MDDNKPVLVNLVFFALLVAESPKVLDAAKPAVSVTRQSPRPQLPTGWTVNPYRIVAVEHSRVSRGRLERWLFQGSLQQQRRVLLAMARLQDPAFLEPINRIINRSRNSQVRQMAAFALGSIESDEAFLFISQHVPMHKDEGLVRELLIAAGRTGNPKAQPFLAHYLSATFPAPIQGGAGLGLGHLFTRMGANANADEAILSALARLAGTVQTDLAGAFPLARYAGEASILPADTIARLLVQMPPGPARALICRVLGRSKSLLGRDHLIQIVLTTQERGEKIEAVKALGAQDPNEPMLSALRQALGDSSRHVQVAALEAIVRLGALGKSLVPDLETLFSGSGSDWVRATAIQALAHVDPEGARRQINESIAKHSGLTLLAMVYSYAVLGTPDDLAHTRLFLGSPHKRLVQKALESLLIVETAKLDEPLLAATGKTLAHRDVGIAATLSDVVEKHHLCQWTMPLTIAYADYPSADAAETRAALVRAIGSCGQKTSEPFLESALKDREKIVAQEAAKALLTMTGKTFAVPLNSAPSAPMPKEGALADLAKRKIVFRTSRGDFSIRFLADTPISSYFFLKNARDMKGRPFHRIVPNFVVQGGDPRGDGFGGAGYNIRDEVSHLPHERGIVGIATAGKDTGSCQFFVNTAPNPHLVGRYTSFATVLSGMDVIDKLEPSDTILQTVVR